MILTFRFLSDEEDDFLLDVNINHDQTFHELHLAIQKTLDYDANQLCSFFKSNSDWEKLDEITLMDMGSDESVRIMTDTRIDEFFSQKGEHILYVFDFFAERLFFGSISRTIDQNSPVPLPSVSKLEGTIPLQMMIDDSMEDDFMDLDDEIMDEFTEELPEDLDNLYSDNENLY